MEIRIQFIKKSVVVFKAFAVGIGVEEIYRKIHEAVFRREKGAIIFQDIVVRTYFVPSKIMLMSLTVKDLTIIPAFGTDLDQPLLLQTA